MKKQSLLFYAICLLFVLAAKGDTAFDTADSISFEGKSYYDVNKICVHVELAKIKNKYMSNE